MPDLRPQLQEGLSSSFTEDYPRFLRAEALLATGQDDEARRWLENGPVVEEARTRLARVMAEPRS